MILSLELDIFGFTFVKNQAGNRWCTEEGETGETRRKRIYMMHLVFDYILWGMGSMKKGRGGRD